MELKQRRITTDNKIPNSLNCTVMELKHLWNLSFLVLLLCLNCTVMELKRVLSAKSASAAICLNCTVMELKQPCIDS